MYPYRIYVIVPFKTEEAFSKVVNKHFRNDKQYKWNDCDLYDSGVGRPFDFLSRRKFVNWLKKCVALKKQYKLMFDVYPPDGETKLNPNKVLNNPKVLDKYMIASDW